jgi:hypothetical protein
MKAILLALMITLTVAQAHAGGKEVCKIQDGKFIGHGATKDAAFEDAATQCFEKFRSQYRAKHGDNVGEDTGLMYIDICANVKCQS